jgi:mannan endo-1,4-beta-mannosidase
VPLVGVLLLGMLLIGAPLACSSETSTGPIAPPLAALNVDLGLRVSGRDLFDRCGEQVVLRGVNEMIVWSQGRDGVPEFAEIAKTGANAVRIVWTNEGSSNALDTVLRNALAQKLIPIVEHHGATGNLAGVPAVVDYWTAPDVVAVLEKYDGSILLNIANEAGDREPASDFESTYRTAISRIRETGLSTPLVIDGPGWGQDIDTLQAAGPRLIEHDPEHNLILSVHMWWSDPSGNRVVTELQESVDLGLPLIVGEFAHHAIYQCDAAPFAYSVLLAEAQKHRMGWLAWSWGSVINQDCSTQGPFDMTERGVYGMWNEPWAEAVVVSDPNGIQNTSVRPASLVNGSCAGEP